MNALQLPSPPGLDRFADKFLPAALAHGREELDPQDRARIEAFFLGDLGEVERQALLPLLGKNVAALEFLATLLVGDKSCGEEE